MSPPKTVTVGPHIYKIVCDTNAINAQCVDQGKALLGNCRSPEGVITIDPKQSESQLADTVLHETLHALMNLVGATEDISDEDEEKLVRRLAPALLDVIRRNPKWVAYLRGEK